MICSTLLENVDVNRFGSRFTLYNANDGSIIVNTTTSLSDFYTLWNQTSHQTQTPGLNLAAIVKKLREIGANLLNDEHIQSQAGGLSFISLIVPQLSAVNEGDSNDVVDKLVYLREVQPDLKILFWAGGAFGRFSRFVTDQKEDLFGLPTFASSAAEISQQIFAAAAPVIRRVQLGNRNKIKPSAIEHF